MTWVFPEVRRRDPVAAQSGSLGDLLVDSPVRGDMIWDSDSQWAADIASIDDKIALSVVMNDVTSSASVNSIIANDPNMTVTDVAYVGQGIRQFSVALTCNDSRQAHGSWSGPVLTETGILTCGVPIHLADAVESNKSATEVQSMYCT